LINPRWANHKFDPKTQKIIPSDKVQGQNTITLDEFKKLKIEESVMRDGILFIWVEKELIYEIIMHFDD
jgi:hypothetical protein